MQYNYESYLECMQGVILEHNYDNSYHSTCKDYILKILVNHPFNAEISIIMNTDTWNKYVNYSVSHNWQGFLESHPENYNSQNFYCNLQDGKFYIASTIDDKDYPVWRESTLEKIINVSHLAWRFSRHIHIDYNRFHTGQTCEFYAYAIDNNDRLYKPSTIEDNFPKYKWIYNPLTFKAHDITSESIEHLIAKTPPPKLVADKIILNHIQEFQHSKTNGLNIDGLVAETPISKEMTDKMVRYHNLERKAQQRATVRQFRQNLLDKLSKFAQFVEKYPTWSVAIISAIVGSLFTFFLGNIESILKWFLKQSGG